MPIRMVPVSLLISSSACWSICNQGIARRPATRKYSRPPARLTMRYLERLMFRFIMLGALFLAASAGSGQAEEKFFGFNLDGKVINPLCLEHIHPWYSDGSIIVRSLILDYC